MGHIRLGRLPKTKRWNQVVAVFKGDSIDPKSLAVSTARAADERFAALKDDQSLSECVWTLARIAAASKTDDFAGELTRLGIDTNRAATGVGFVAEISRVVEARLRSKEPSIFAEMAQASLQGVLAGRVVEQSKSLFGSTLDDVQAATATFGTDRGFGSAVRRFYGDFMSRALRFLTDKELSNHIGYGHAVSTIDGTRELNTNLDRYCRESAGIVEEFAAGWYSKHNWLTGRNIERDQAQRFNAYALEKLRMEISEAGQ